MESENKKNHLVDEIARLIVGDCLELHQQQAKSITKFISLLSYEYGVIFNKDGRVYFDESISRKLGSDDIVTEVGDINRSDYLILNGVPPFVSELKELSKKYNDIITVAKLIKYPITSIIDQEHVDISEEYLTFLGEVYAQIRPYFRVYPTSGINRTSKFDIRIKQKEEIQKLSDKIGAFVNEE